MRFVPFVLWLSGCILPVDESVDGDLDGFLAQVDCNDSDPTVFPGAIELCDGVDQGCDDDAIDEADVDEDGFRACDDCDDFDATRNPGAAELCDGIDQDCDGVIPEAESDADQDGSRLCVDCAPDDPEIGTLEPEVCDGVDQDCDSQIDDDPLDGQALYVDLDGDGFGSGDAANRCPGPHMSDNGADCDDSAIDIFPGAPEACDSLDHDCNGTPGDVDGDSDGYTACNGDCDDEDPLRFAGNVEICDDEGRDDDCDTFVNSADANLYVPAEDQWCPDEDSDGYRHYGVGTSACEAPGDTWQRCGVWDQWIDCDNSTSTVGPPPYWYTDADGDGFGEPTHGGHACSMPVGAAPTGDDCDDGDAAINPGRPEVCDDARVDENCDGSYNEIGLGYTDADGDGFGTGSLVTGACADLSSDDDDCQDINAAVNPAATEICNSSVATDEDCDGLTDDADPSVTGTHIWCADSDHDTVGDLNDMVVACTGGTGYNINCDASYYDCDDTNEDIRPGGVEVCNAGVDDDCDGDADDADWDAFSPIEFVLQSAWWAPDADGNTIPDAAGRPWCEQPPDSVLFPAVPPVFGVRPLRVDQAVIADVGPAGEASVLLGGLATVSIFYGPIDRDFDSSMVDATLSSSHEAVPSVTALAADGDIDADGSIDVVVGYTTNDGAGYVALLRGPAHGGDLHTMADASHAFGELPDDHFGGDIDGTNRHHPITMGADLNEDGPDEIAIGAPGYLSNQGALVILSEPPEGPLDLTVDTSTLVIGASAGDGFGADVLAFGDLRGADDFDLAVFAPGAAGGLGAIYILPSADLGYDVDHTPQTHSVSNTADYLVRIVGTGDPIVAMGACGDIDDDGYPELAVGTPDNIYVFTYLEIGHAAEYVTTDAPIVLNQTEGHSAPYPLDVNGDGSFDLLSSRTFGSSMVVTPGPFGSGTYDVSDAIYETGSIDPAVLGVGDIDGDGRSDIIGGDPNTAGAVNLWLGRAM